MKLILGVTDVVYELNYFKSKISAILKHHCCHSNGSCVTFVNSLYVYNSFVCGNTTYKCITLYVVYIFICISLYVVLHK
jgi:hypothetical protein